MRKRIVSLILILCIAVGLIGCTDGSSIDSAYKSTDTVNINNIELNGNVYDMQITLETDQDVVRKTYKDSKDYDNDIEKYNLYVITVLVENQNKDKTDVKSKKEEVEFSDLINIYAKDKLDGVVLVTEVNENDRLIEKVEVGTTTNIIVKTESTAKYLHYSSLNVQGKTVFNAYQSLE